MTVLEVQFAKMNSFRVVQFGPAACFQRYSSFAWGPRRSTVQNQYQQSINRLSSGCLEDYNQPVRDLAGAAHFGSLPVYKLDSGKETKVPEAEHRGSRLRNELEKSDLSQLPVQTTVPDPLHVLQEFAGEEQSSVWASDTFTADMNLPVDNQAPCPGLLALFMAEKRPVVLLSLFQPEEADSTEAAERFVVDVAKALTWRLLEFCHVDFLVLACAMPWENLSVDSLRDKLNDELECSGLYYGGPRELTVTTFDTLRKAAVAVSQTTPVPALYPEVKDKNFLVLLDRDWFAVVTLLIEAFARGKGVCDVFFTPETEFKVKVAVLEAARRLGFTAEVVIVADDKKMTSCVTQMTEQVKENYAMTLRVSCRLPRGNSQEETRPTPSTVVSSTVGRAFLPEPLVIEAPSREPRSSSQTFPYPPAPSVFRDPRFEFRIDDEALEKDSARKDLSQRLEFPTPPTIEASQSLINFQISEAEPRPLLSDRKRRLAEPGPSGDV